MGGAGGKEAQIVKSFFETKLADNQLRIYPEIQKIFDEHKKDINSTLRVDVKCEDKSEHKNYNIIHALTFHSSDDVDLLEKFLSDTKNAKSNSIFLSTGDNHDAISL